MPAPAFRVSGNIISGTMGLTPIPGAGRSANDIDLLFVETANEAVTLGTPNGFAELTNIGLTGTRITVFWRRWNGTDGDPVLNDAGDHMICRIHSFSGVITSGNPWDVFGTNTQAATTSGSVSSITTTVINTLIVLGYTGALPDANSTNEFTNEANSNLTAVTVRADNTRNSGNGGALGCFEGVSAGIQTIGASTYDSVESTEKANFAVALRPPVAGALSIPVAMHEYRQRHQSFEG